MIRVPGEAVVGKNDTLPKPDVKQFSMGHGKYLKPYYCLLCRRYGHAMVDCDWLSDEQHQRAKKLQREVPLTEAERRFLRDVKIALADIRSDTFGSNSSENSGTEDEEEQEPENWKEDRN